MVDIKGFPSMYAVRKFIGLPDDPNYPQPEFDIEQAAGDILALLTGEGEDITGKSL